jgi:hypothetical protein
MAESRFGPNSKEVERFLDRLGRLDRKQWQAIQESAPEAGAVPEHDVSAAPEYFKALSRAARLAKSGVFRGSESAFYEAMRLTHHQAETLVAGLGGTARLHRATSSAQVEGDDPEAILRLMAEEFENETWERAVNACMIAAGALVLRRSLSDGDFRVLYQPLDGQLGP